MAEEVNTAQIFDKRRLSSLSLSLSLSTTSSPSRGYLNMYLERGVVSLMAHLISAIAAAAAAAAAVAAAAEASWKNAEQLLGTTPSAPPFHMQISWRWQASDNGRRLPFNCPDNSPSLS